MCVRQIRIWNFMNFIYENRFICLIDIQLIFKMSLVLFVVVIINFFFFIVEEFFYRVLVEFFIVIRRSFYLCIVL